MIVVVLFLMFVFPQALALSRNLATKRSSEVVQQRRITELEKAMLRTELEQSHIKVQELELRRGSLTVGYRQLNEKYKKLEESVGAWQRENAEVEKSCQARIDKIEGEFERFRVHFRRSLRDLHYELEDVLSNLGARCLPYPEKGTPMRDLIKWFEGEVKSLPEVFGLVNQNFVAYALVGVLRMLQDSGCEHFADTELAG
jgi:hypothetical protein